MRTTRPPRCSATNRAARSLGVAHLRLEREAAHGRLGQPGDQAIASPLAADEAGSPAVYADLNHQAAPCPSSG